MSERIHIIPNWSKDESIYPIALNENPLRREWGLEKKFVVGYSGNLGRVHEYDTVLAAAQRLKTNPAIVFLFIGGGHLMRLLAKRVQECGLNNFRFMDYQDESVLNFSLGAADVHWISLNPQFEGFIVPSKFYGIAAAGRPMISICRKDGEISRSVQQYECGFVIEPGNVDQLVESILRLSSDAELLARMGRNARTMLDACFTRRQALEHWQRLIEQIGSIPRAT